MKRVIFISLVALVGSACASTPKHLIGRPIPQDHLAEIPGIQRPDIPLVMNDRVQDWIDFFQGSGRSRFELFLARSGRYIPMMRKILRQNGLPQDLVYLAMIESGFNPHAYSRARATGTWQFIYQTGIRYGLRANSWVDERRDPEKSTVAAAQYLKELHDRFNNWYLAAAGYNAGEGKIGRAIRRYETEDFWQLARMRYLRLETKDYVPKLIAAALIAKSPERYGFRDVVYEEPVKFDEVSVDRSVDLRVAARCAGVSYEEVKGLNPELLHWMTPPDYPHYLLKLPAGTASVFEKNKTEIEPSEWAGKGKLPVKSTVTVRRLARRHGVSPILFAAVNGLSPESVVRAGESVVLPYDPPPGESFRERAYHRVRVGRHGRGKRVGALRRSHRGAKAVTLASRSAEPPPSTDQSYVRYRLRSGESLKDVARKYKISSRELRRFNGLSSARQLKRRRTLKIPLPPTTTTSAATSM